MYRFRDIQSYLSKIADFHIRKLQTNRRDSDKEGDKSLNHESQNHHHHHHHYQLNTHECSMNNKIHDKTHTIKRLKMIQKA